MMAFPSSLSCCLHQATAKRFPNSALAESGGSFPEDALDDDGRPKRCRMASVSETGGMMGGSIFYQPKILLTAVCKIGRYGNRLKLKCYSYLWDI